MAAPDAASASCAASPAPPEERVTFRNAAGEALVGDLLDTGSREACLLCHGYQSRRERCHRPELAARLAARGLSSLRFDFSGNGDSEGAFEYGNIGKEVGDIEAAVAFLRSRGKTVRAILGHSKGGTVVLTHATRHPGIPLVVNLAGRFDTSSSIQRRFGQDVLERLKRDKRIQMQQPFPWMLTEESALEWTHADMEGVCKAIAAAGVAQVLTIHGSDDEVIPVEEANRFAALLAPRHQLAIVAGADHSFTDAQLAPIMVQHAVEFMSQEL